MPAVGNQPLFKIQLAGFYLEQRVRNVWYWIAESPVVAPDAATVASDFITAVVTPLIAQLHTGYTTQGVEVIQENDTSNFGSVASVAAGGEVGDGLPSYVVASVRFNRTDRELRNGWKRFSGMTEQNLDGNDLISSYGAALSTAVAPQADRLSLGGVTLTPAIVRRSKDPDTGETLPVDQWRWVRILGANVFARVGTQNSRKAGRGE